MYICVCIYTFISLYMYIYIYIYVCIHMYIHICVCTRVCWRKYAYSHYYWHCYYYYYCHDRYECWELTVYNRFPTSTLVSLNAQHVSCLWCVCLLWLWLCSCVLHCVYYVTVSCLFPLILFVLTLYKYYPATYVYILHYTWLRLHYYNMCVYYCRN